MDDSAIERTTIMPRWAYEAVGRKKDDKGRWMVHQLTASSMISNNIYCEQPYSSPDGQRVRYNRMLWMKS